MKAHILLLCYFLLSSHFGTALSAVTYCAHGMCLCDNKKHKAVCQSERKRQKLMFFPTLPNYIEDVTVRNFKCQNISTNDLQNFTALPLTKLSLENLDIRFMQSGMFQYLKNLRKVEISNNTKLTTGIVRDAFLNISLSLHTLILTSNRWNNIVPDLFTYVSHTNLRTLILSRNQLLKLPTNVFRDLNLTALDLSWSNFKDIKAICGGKINLFPHLERLQLQSTKLKVIMPSLFDCFPELRMLNLESTKLGDFPGFCLSSENKSNKMKTLFLRNTGIEGEISNKRFKCLHKLKILDLSRNKITRVPHFCNSLGKSNVPQLEQLRLQFTSISRLQNKSLMCMSTLRILDLGNNLLRDIPMFCGEKHESLTPNLTSLYLLNTSIITLQDYRFQCLPRLRELDLRFNFFAEIPLFCNEVKESIHPNLQALNLSHTKIRFISMNSFTCLPSLRKLDLSFTELHQLNDNIFSPLRSIEWLQIGNVRSLKKISNHTFNISSLINMKFVNNDFNFENTLKYTPEKLFALCTNITKLDLRGNHFPTGPIGHLILKPLRRLEDLSLQENRMDTIHVDTFKSLTTLKTLSLTQNKLIGWKASVFKNLSNLVHLRLDHNRIAVLNRTSIPPEIMDNLETLTLAYNPFDCGCDMIWFKNWCQETNVTLLNFPVRYTCQTPANMLRKRILALNLTADDCKEKNPWIIILISTSASAVFLVIVSIMISVHLPSIRNVIYYFRLRRRGYVKILNEQEFKYDAYVVYCEADEKWVFRKLVPRLEAKGIRLCIPDREFEVGAERCSEIENAFKESKKIVVILSNEFVKNEWCLWQNNLVEERIRQRGDSSVVFLLYKSINSKNMISSVHRTLKSRSIVTWYEGGAQESMFWKVVVLALEAPLGEPPMSVMDE